MLEELRPAKMLVIMLRRIGDVLLTTPAVRALKRRFPSCELHFLTEPPGAQAIEGDPSIDRVLPYAALPGEGAISAHLRWLRVLRKERYDWAIDYMGNPRSAILTFASGARLRAGPAHVWHRWAYNRRLAQSPAACYAGLEKIKVLAALGVESDPEDCLPRLLLPPSCAEGAVRMLHSLWPDTTGPLIGLVPASRKETRRWPAVSFGELGRRLGATLGARVLVFWGPGEEQLAAEVVRGAGPSARVSPKTAGIKELGALIARCRLVVTNCNGPKHVAVACGVPTVTIHGSSDPVCWNPPGPGSGPPGPGSGPPGPGSGPPGPRHVAVRCDDLPCIGCRSNHCRLTTLACLRDLSVERVERAALELLRAPAGRPR